MSKIRIRLNKGIFIILISLALIISLIIFYNFYSPKPIKSWRIGNFVFVFRADLREANKIPVYPSKDAVYLKLINPIVKNVTIAFKDAGEENYYYSLETYEIVYKLSLFYKIKGMEVNFDSMQVDSYENLPGKFQNPIIALVHPKFSNETAIRIEDHVIYIQGKTAEEFDLATVKFLVSAMGIEV